MTQKTPKNSWGGKVKTSILLITGTLIVLAAWGWWYLTNRPKPPGELSFHQYLMSLPDRSRVRATINDRTYTLEVVNTPASIHQGLSDRLEIGADGMLFVMPAKTFHNFWMPRMHFALDILWLDDEIITQVTANVPAPAPQTQNWQLPIYTSEKPANLVLELPAGRAALMDIQAGAKIELLK